MKVDTKEVAKFFAGVTAWEALVHFSFMSCDMLPLSFCNITITSTVNTIQIIVPALISVTLAGYAWFYRR